MNYQPFYGMNILVSDSMLQVLQQNQIYLILIFALSFYLLMFLHIQLFRFHQTLRQLAKRHYPQHNIT